MGSADIAIVEQVIDMSPVLVRHSPLPSRDSEV